MNTQLPFQAVCDVADVPEGQARIFVLDERPIGIFHVNGRFFALVNHCPHAGASLAHGYLEGETVVCRIHHWHFSLRDGTYLDEDKPQCNVQTFPVRVRDGQVQVALAANRL
jgi:NAD(P)H-dependent nitrite reductase small subunit